MKRTVDLWKDAESISSALFSISFPKPVINSLLLEKMYFPMKIHDFVW